MKGSILDIPVIFIILFGFAFLILFSYAMVFELRSSLDDIDNYPTLAKEQVDSILGIMKFFDYGVLIIFISLSITTILLARNLPSHPAYFILSVVSMVIVMIIIYIIQEVFTSIASNSSFVTYSNSFPIMSTILNNSAYFALGLFILISLAIYIRGDSVATQII